jgi:RNA polymerase sigma-70 factor, ECF subfamily
MQEIERELIEKAGRGDMQSFRELYDRTSGYVYGLAYRVTGRKHDAEEVAQDVYVKIHRSLAAFHFQSAFKTWLYRVALNTALNHLKKKGRIAGREVEDTEGFHAVASPEAIRNVEISESEVKLKRMLERLNPDQRACLVLRELEGMDYQAISETLGINLNTVRSRLKRAREALIMMGKEEVTNDAMLQNT